MVDRDLRSTRSNEAADSIRRRVVDIHPGRIRTVPSDRPFWNGLDGRASRLQRDPMGADVRLRFAPDPADALAATQLKIRMAATNPNANRYGLNERPPLLSALGLGAQGALLNVPPMVLYPLIAVQIAGGTPASADWLIFTSLAATGVTMVLQTMRVGIVGSGCHLSAVPSAVAIPFCALAMTEGGPKTLAALVFLAGLFGFAVALRLSLLRRIFTPTVTGTISILLVITIVSVLFEKVDTGPVGRVNAAGMLCGAVTLASTLAFLLRKPGFWRVWGPLFGLALGCIAAAALGILNLEALRQALWVGVPL